MFLFLLNCGGRPQDAHNVDSKGFFKAIDKDVPFRLECKKNSVNHYVLLDKRIKKTVRDFVVDQCRNGVEFVWGPN